MKSIFVVKDVYYRQAPNIWLTAVMASIWTLLTCLIVWPLVGEYFYWIAIAGAYHFIWGCLALHYIFGYGVRKATDWRIIERWVRSYWIVYSLSLIGFLFLYQFLGIGMGTSFSLAIGWMAKGRLSWKLRQEFVSGTRSLPFDALAVEYRRKVSAEDKGMLFGGLDVPVQDIPGCRQVVGSCGRGKSILLRLMLQSCSDTLWSGGQTRTLVFDEHNEFEKILVGMGVPRDAIIIVNPYDSLYARAWDMAKDISSRLDAENFVEAFFWEKKMKHDVFGRICKKQHYTFYSKKARHIVVDLMWFFMHSAPGVWTLRDIVLACADLETLKRFLSQCGQQKTQLGVFEKEYLFYTVYFVRERLERIAAILDYHRQAGRTFTLDDWMQSDSVLLMGYGFGYAESLFPLRLFLFSCVAQRLMARESHDGKITHIVLDDLPILGRLDDLLELAGQAQKRGISLTISFQTYSQIVHLYGRKAASALTSQCRSSAFLGCADWTTAQWAAEYIGNMRVLQRFGREDDGEQHVPIMSAEELRNASCPDITDKTGIQGWYKIGKRAYSHEITSEYLSEHLKPLNCSAVNRSIPRSAYKLRPWGEDDIQRLGLQSLVG